MWCGEQNRECRVRYNQPSWARGRYDLFCIREAPGGRAGGGVPTSPQSNLRPTSSGWIPFFLRPKGKSDQCTLQGTFRQQNPPNILPGRYNSWLAYRNSLHSVTACSFPLLWEAGTPLRVKGLTHLFQTRWRGLSHPRTFLSFGRERAEKEGGTVCMRNQPTFPRRDGGAHPANSHLS